jgi:nucleotide-binding universal stress UspA family protein
MPIKTILVAASGGSATDGAFGLACGLASRLHAHVEGYHVLIDPVAVLAAFGAGDGVAVSGAFVDEMVADAAAGAAQTKAAFDAAAQRYGLAPKTGPGGEGSSCCWRQDTGYAPDLIAARARFFDVVVLGRSERAVRGPHSDTIERTLEGSGRPVLLAPSRAPAKTGSSIALAWNGSVEAVHATVAALPILTAADTVTVITAGDDSSDVADAIGYLAWHGISAEHRGVAYRPGDTIGATLLKAAQGAGADLLVMGGYGRRPWREGIFGGATHEVLGIDAPLPLLLVH